MADDDVLPLDMLTPDEKRVFLRDLKEAFYSGAHRVRFRERDVTYRSMGEMKQIIDQLERELTKRKPRPAIFTTFGRGY
ncbi:phage head-tail joining protein [Agrobacterium tumefaciens]|uniref:phage head-tail joining protein n=1 Tax=Agrobacterium tumefaciens TaxID=358 RepID=UPI001574D327|nr:hypothetical protein [Agrobacterium tumefaciens]NTD85484.1 hypothetical protein [Agrobacterium tumefaciens]NTD90833.1 hypothetical protein [Agrobacterium tumefaciens]NTE03655.1 hypothetical protein [Agrobacterium tumefaciens]NTE15907.1 hypothetical protein [Agrobacterium tumefaciens]NTE26481.1 hypothetical protein [Agrobacterium tumefaciens]